MYVKIKLTVWVESLLEIVQEEEDDSEATLPIRDLDAVAIHIPVVEASRERVVTEMESMVNQGLETLVCHFRLIRVAFTDSNYRIIHC